MENIHTYIIVLLGNITGIIRASERPKVGSRVNVVAYNDKGSKVLLTGIVSDILN
jgi:hypothetical protein